jgi:hypothetical protein
VTTQEMIDELRLSLGNRTDITDARYVQWLNWAQYDLCGFHRKRAFPSLRFRALEKRMLWNISVVTGTAQSGSSTGIVLAAGSSSTDDYFNDCVIELTDYSGTAPDNLLNQKRIITDYDGATLTCTLDEAWDVNPDANTVYKIYRREYDIQTFLGINPTQTLWAIERLETVRGTEIEKKDWESLIYTDGTGAISSVPEKFARRGETIVFDKWIEEDIAFRVWYYQYPTLLNSGAPTVEPSLPEPWHEIIVIGGVWRGFDKLMEPDRADAAYKKYEDEATNRINQYQVEDASIKRSFKVTSYHAEL